MSHLENEIHEQPEAAARLLASQVENARRIAAAIQRFQPAFVCIAARGTSDNAARYAQYLFGTHLKKMVALATPSVHTLYEVMPDLSKALVIGISQSGQSEDIRCVVEDARNQGALTVSLTNDEASPLAQLAEFHMALGAGAEKAVAATKTYTTELTAIALLTGALLQNTEYDAALAQLPQMMRQTLETSAAIAGWIDRYRYAERYAVIARGYNYCTAYEISLKIKELCYMPGEEYSEADFRHGPIAVVQPGFPVLLVAPKGKTFPVMLDLLQKVYQKQAECLVITNDETCQPYAKHIMPIPAHVPEWLSPIVSVIPGQMFAMRLAETRGYSLDQPVGLTKVTNTI